jgi:hypothetical protein
MLSGMLTVHLVPRAGVTGAQRVNFAVPLAPQQLTSDAMVRVLQAGNELATARRGLARHPDGSFRSVQLQVDVVISGETDLEVRLGESATAGDLARVPVEQTLDPVDGTQGPRVWALLPATWLSATLAGPQVPEAEVASTTMSAWTRICNYDRFNADSFVSQISDATVWLFDRGTAMYRGYARRGDLGTLSSAYRETSIYFNGITGTGTATRIGVPGKADDLKYHYTQNLALHYLMTGDDRFRIAAENVAQRAHALFPRPGYSQATNFWTERHAGFGLLAYVFAMIVSENAMYRTWADEAVDAFLATQESFPAEYTDPDARCFAHTAEAHGEGYGYVGCSPWMSAILADGLEAYAAESDATRAARARTSLVKLGRVIAESGLDPTGKPYYWMGIGVAQNEVDDYEEHWGESAYLVAMAWHYDGRRDPMLRQVADDLISGLSQRGVAPHMRSFNWQCRSSVGAPAFLR